VRHTEGQVHGFLALRALEGQKLADGEITQIAKGERVTAELIFRFRDGSIYRDETVFTQKGDFRLLSEHLVEKGPSFRQPIETLIDASSGQVTVRYTDHGKEGNPGTKAGPAARPRQRTDIHHSEAHRSEHSANDSTPARVHAEAAARQDCDHS
jgi:hypothetical protein